MMTGMGDRASGLERRKEEEVGFILECDVLLLVPFTLENMELDNRRRIDRSTVGRRFFMLA